VVTRLVFWCCLIQIQFLTTFLWLSPHASQYII
jgi:hypothetical protein